MDPLPAAAQRSSRAHVRGQRPTIGVLYGWQIHTGGIDSYFEALVAALAAAADRADCNLLMSFGVSSTQWHAAPAWPTVGPNRTFSPVGPWNTDGLIVINPLPAEDTLADVRRFQRDGHPLVFLSRGPDQPMIVPDNRGGIASAVEHLAEHGHRRIAYLACETGDGPERREAYEETVRALGLAGDPALIVDAKHERFAGSHAIDRLVENGVEFTAVLASNGGSARGALLRLNELGIAVPDDVSLIAFDDFIEALATEPAMTCVHFPVECSAQAALDSLLALIEDGTEPPPLRTIQTRLVLRESCGCTPAYNGEAAERARRSLVKQLIDQAEVSRAVSTFAGRLLATPQLDTAELGRILLETLPQIGITNCMLGVYDGDADDPVGWSEVRIDPDRPLFRFPTRTFPPPELVADDRSFQLTVMPLRLHDESGFIAVPSGGISSCVAIVSQCEAAFESARNVRVREEAEAALAHSEERLRQAQKMEAIGQLAGGIAHDFNNLLTPIIGCSDLLLSSLDDPSQRGKVELISDAAERAAALTRQLLAFSCRQIMQPVVLDLNAVVEDTRTLLGHVLGSDVELSMELYGPVHVEVDRSQLEQVVINLAMNARDAMPAGGNLSISTGSVSIEAAAAADARALPPGDYATLMVRDTGTGIADDVRPHIFEPFFTTKEDGKGTGFGLATVYGILKQIGGDIAVESAPGAGSTFIVYLPRVAAPTADGDAAAQPEQTDRADVPHVETVLLAEDETTVRRFMRELLEMYGYSVIEAADGVEALELCRLHANEIDALVTDLTMPNMNGKELLEAVAREHPDIAVLCMSGYAQESIFDKYVISPKVAFIAKPFSGQALVEKLREVLAARAAAPLPA